MQDSKNGNNKSKSLENKILSNTILTNNATKTITTLKISFIFTLNISIANQAKNYKLISKLLPF